MSSTLDLFRREPQVRVFFAACAQSAIGTGAGYVALLLLAYERYRSPWAISLVLLADVAPAIVLGPLFGALADRWSRRNCAIVADVIRAAAFAAIAVVDSFIATLVFAVMAGTGTALFRPAVLAGLGGLVSRERLAAATGVYSAITSADILLGPAIGALVLLFASSEALLTVNAVTFVISALALTRVDLGVVSAAESQPGARSSLLAEARLGLQTTIALRGVRVIVGASAGVLMFAGLFNVAELPFARGDLDAGDAGFSLLVAAFGVGIAVGSLAGGRATGPSDARRTFLIGLGLVAAGFLAAAALAAYPLALAAFALAGVGNGLVVVSERILIHASVRDVLLGRVFGAASALDNALFTGAFVAAGALLAVLEPRTLIAAAGVGTGVVGAIAAVALRGSWQAPAGADVGPALE